MIKKIKVENLFDYYSYDVDLMNSGSKITIIHAPNGYGKTTMFRLTKALLTFDVAEIMGVPFSSFTIIMSDETEVSATNRKKVLNDGGWYYLLVLSVKIPFNDPVEFTIKNNNRICEEILRAGNIGAFVRRREERSNRSFGGDPTLKSEPTQRYEKFRDALNNVTKGFNIDFIGSNRLYSNNGGANSDRMFRREMNMISRSLRDEYEYYKSQEVENESIIKAAEDILKQVQNVRQRYSLVSEKMDRDFPNRLVHSVTERKEPFEEAQIIEKVNELFQKRKELEEAGLALAVDSPFLPVESAGWDETMKMFYTLYIQDTLNKLSLYDDIKGKLELFIKILNEKTAFSNKRMRIDSEKGVVFDPIESKSGEIHSIPLEKLSSGEKHGFILFYELIFNTPANSIVLIDEPEISLHVAWQMEFVNILEEICKLNGVQAVIATHSPDIVNGRNDLLVSLGMGDD